MSQNKLQYKLVCSKHKPFRKPFLREPHFLNTLQIHCQQQKHIMAMSLWVLHVKKKKKKKIVESNDCLEVGSQAVESFLLGKYLN